MKTGYLFMAVLSVVLTACQGLVPEGTPSAPVATASASEEMTTTVEITSTEEVTSTGVQGSEVSDLATLVDALRAAGATVEPRGEMGQAFLSVPGQQIFVNGGNVQVFEYPSTEAAAADAGQISPDGSSTATAMITWVEPPHFYYKDQLLVLYVGSDEAIQQLLAGLLGHQFAGQ